MMKVLIKNEWKMYVNNLRSTGIKGFVMIGISILVIAALLSFLSVGIWNIATAIPHTVVTSIASYSFLVIIAMLILLGTPQVFKNLYSSTDLSFLFTMPIPTRQLFWIKYLKSYISTPLFLLVIFFVPFFIYGIRMHVSLLYYPILFLVILSFTLIGLSISYLINLVLIQIIPAQRANELMTALSVLSGLIVYGLFQIPNLLSDSAKTDLMSKGLPLFPAWTPMSWAGSAITNAIEGSASFVLPTIAILVTAIIFVLLSSALVEKGFRTGWIRISEGKPLKKKKAKRAVRVKKQKIHHPIIAIGHKEWLAIKRDMREWMVFLPFLFVMVFPLIGVLNSGVSFEDILANKDSVWIVAQAFLLFFYANFNGTIAASSIAREAETASVLKMLPISNWQLVIGKLWISWLLPLIFFSVIEIVIGIILQWSIFQLLGGIVLKAILSIGVSGIGIWLGTIGAKYNPANPQNRLTFGAGILMLIISYLYLFLALFPFALLSVPSSAESMLNDFATENGGFIGSLAYIVALLLKWKTASPVLSWSLGIIMATLFSFGVAWLFLKLSTIRIKNGIVVKKAGTGSATLRRKRGNSLY
ncbi:hypothetical protein J9303_10165 [Bacillaceae bacterium Marseille-Q3522]|nr:hypothetical protein [Bacillaceae bacterium Marseille-Q3522]